MLASNYLKRLALRVLVVSVKEKPRLTRHVWSRETNKTESLLTRRNANDDIKTGDGL